MAEHGGNPKTLKKIIKEYGLSEDQLNINRSNFYKKCANKSNECREITRLEDVFANKKTMQGTRLIKRMIEEGYKENKCERCGITDWMGMPLTLQLHHKDGNHYNNQFDNLEILCPNCHTQTDTYGAKNIKNKAKNNKKVMKIVKSSFIEDTNNDAVISEDNNYKICNCCGKRIFNGLELCWKCKALLKAKEERRKNINIIDIVNKFENEHKNFQTIADEFGVGVNIIINDYKNYKGTTTIYELFGDRDYYKNMIRTYSFLEISRKLGVTDNAIRKWCKKLNLPYKKREIDRYTDEEWELI